MNQTLITIGHITTPYSQLDHCPNNIQENGPTCELVLKPEFQQGMTGLQKGQRILVLYWFEGGDRTRLIQSSQSTAQTIGAFALRSPHRPNPIAAATVIINDIIEDRILVTGFDCLDGTKLLDIKPDI